MDTENKCGFCGAHSTLKCTGCQLVYYCCSEHQKKDWRVKHKNECVKPYKLASNDEIGRFFEATEDIKKDTILFAENPLVVGPKWNLHEYEQRSMTVPCVGCFVDCRLGEFHCGRCLWPACKPDCPGLKNSKLHGLECGILRFGNPPKPGDDREAFFDYFRYDALLPLKCLAIQIRSPALFEQMMKLESHYDARKNTDYFHDADERVVSYLFRNFLEPIRKQECKEGRQVLKMCDRKILHIISGILEVNAMVIPLSNGREICGLYASGSIFEHCCVPNAFYTFDCSKGMKLTFKAGRDIKKGEHLSTSYTHSLWGTQLRREHLRTNKYFICKCERCSDPTEMNTFVSALRCMGLEGEPCVGFQLPIDPISDVSDWKCNSCMVQMSHDQVNFLMTKIGEEVDDVMERKASVKEFEDLISKLQTFLHPNHFHLLTLKHSLVQMYGHFIGYKLSEIQDGVLNTKLAMCRDMMQIIDMLDSQSFRLTLYAGVILLEQQAALNEINRRTQGKLAVRDPDVLHENIKRNNDEARQCLNRAKNILKNEMGTEYGKKLLKKVLDALESMGEEPAMEGTDTIPSLA